jgi:hypothetical protein
MPRFEELDPKSALYLGPTSIGDAGDDMLTGKDLMPQAPTPPDNILRKQMQQIKPFVPAPNPKTGVPDFSTNSINSFVNNAAQNIGSHQDPFYFGKSTIGDFRNPHLQHQFYDRYSSHADFEKLGFTPFRDNESLYNENSSWWNEIGRATKPMARLAVTAFADAMPGNWGPPTDRENAEFFERQMLTGSSSKGGLTGFTTNLYLNSGYTVGIIAEMLAEEAALLATEAALGAATAATFGGAAPVTGPAMVATGALMAARGARGIKKINSAWKTANNLRKTLFNLQDVNKAKKYWNKTVGSAGNFLNPFENTYQFFKTADNMHDLQNTNKALRGIAKTGKGFGAFYSDVKGMRLAYAESSLEGGMVQNQMERDLLQEFQQKNGRMPNKQEAIDIRTTASQAGVSTALWNMPVIHFSNKITFDGLLRNKFRNVSADVLEAEGIIGKILFNPKKGIKDAYTRLSDGFFSRQWQKIKTPRLLLTSLSKYGKANVAEGLQEIGQETIAGWQEDYYKALYEGDPKRGGYYSYLADNLMKQVSPQGFETFMSGFLMGGPIAAVSKVAGKATNRQTLSDLSMRFKKPAEWAKTKEERRVKIDEAVTKLNEFYNNPEQYLSDDLINMVQQGEFSKMMTLAEQEGDKQAFYDMKDSSNFQHISTALKYGRFDAHVQNLKDMKSLSEEDIKESYKMTKAEWDKTMDVAVERAEQIKARYDLAKEQYKNPYDPKLSRKKANTVEELQYVLQEQEYLKSAYTAWNNTVDELVFNQYSFDRALERQESILKNAKEVSGLKNTPYSQFNVLFDLKTGSTELTTLKAEIDAFENAELINAEQKKFVKDKQDQYDKLKAYLDAITDGRANLDDAGKFSEENYDAIKKAYDDYVSYVSKKNGDFLNSRNALETFKEIMDYHLLGERSFAANDAVNVLLDPTKFKQSFDRNLEVARQIHLNRKAEIKKSLEEFMKIQDKNDMLNELFEAGMFMDIKDLTDLEEKGRVPDTFYYITEQGNGSQEVAADSEDYEKAIEIISKYVPPIYNIDIGKRNTDPYTQSGRAKLKNDKRSYEALAKQFGFDSQAPETILPLASVLTTIMNSKQATARERELAKKLLENVTSKETVTFVKNATRPGSYDESTQTVIDARWSSDDYKQGREGAPIELVILKQEMARRAVEAVEKDTNFKGTMKQLMQEARTAYDNLSDEEKANLRNPDKRQFEGFKSEKGFVAEAMTNERFQAFLGTITTSMDNKVQSGWKTFVQKVLRHMRKILGVTPNGTVLNAAMNAITAKLDTMYTSLSPSAAKVEKTTEAEVRNKVTNKMPISELLSKHPELANAVYDAYIAENEARDERAADLLDEDYKTKSKQEILESVEFAMYFKSAQWKKKEDIIKEYNKSGKVPGRSRPVISAFTLNEVSDEEFEEFESTGNVSRIRLVSIAERYMAGEREGDFSERERAIFADKISEINKYIEDVSQPVTRRTISRDMKTSLKKLGWTERELKTMRVADAMRYIARGLTKSEEKTLELSAKKEIKETLDEQRKKIRSEIESQIQSAASYGELMEIKTQILIDLENNPARRTAAGYKGNELDILFDAKADEFELSINFEELEVDDLLVLNDGKETLVRVSDIDGTQKFIVVEYLNDLTKQDTIKESELNDKVLYQDNEAMSSRVKEEEDIDILDEDNQESANETTDNSEDVDVGEVDFFTEDEGTSWKDNVNKECE